ncbi:MAG: hypothetical protein B6A08_04820 [Sorangiineae bacterium NIC37A_2]|jgi:hypothetical protein|nr:MAG: hypothetical protein B6A08_04820 [Sorangiineae bacterium NIC37A_2]
MDHSKMKYVYVISGKGERKFWSKIGVAFVNRDGSLNCKLESLPVDGELHIRDAAVREDRDGSTSRRTPSLASVG